MPLSFLHVKKFLIDHLSIVDRKAFGAVFLYFEIHRQAAAITCCSLSFSNSLSKASESSPTKFWPWKDAVQTHVFMVRVNLKWSSTTSLCSNWILELAATADVMTKFKASLAMTSSSFNASVHSSSRQSLVWKQTLHQESGCAWQPSEPTLLLPWMKLNTCYMSWAKWRSLGSIKCGGHIWNSTVGVKRRWKDSSLWRTAVVFKNVKVDWGLSLKVVSFTWSVWITPYTMQGLLCALWHTSKRVLFAGLDQRGLLCTFLHPR